MGRWAPLVSKVTSLRCSGASDQATSNAEELSEARKSLKHPVDYRARRQVEEVHRGVHTRWGSLSTLVRIRGFRDSGQARVLEGIEAFAEEFPLVRTVTIKPLVGKLWEMKLGRIRVLYGVVASVLCVVLLFVKKSQKTPSGALELARRRLEEMTEELKS